MAMLGILFVLALTTLPLLTGYRSLVVTSASMAPGIPTGAVVVARPLEPEWVRVGHVVLVQREGSVEMPVLHRVVDRRTLDGQVLITTKGDNNRSIDPEPYVLRDRTYTPVVVLPRVGFVFGAVSHPLGWLALVIVPGAVLAALAIVDVWSKPDETDGDPPVG